MFKGYDPDADPNRHFMCDEPGCDKRAMFGEDCFLLKGKRGTWRCVKHWREWRDGLSSNQSVAGKRAQGLEMKNAFDG